MSENYSIEDNLKNREIVLETVFVRFAQGESYEKLLLLSLVEIARALNLQTELYLEAELERKKLYANIPGMAVTKPVDYTKMLIEATEKRDKIQASIYELETTVKKMPEEMRDFLLATSKPTFEGQLEEMNRYISSLQEMMEGEGG